MKRATLLIGLIAALVTGTIYTQSLIRTPWLPEQTGVVAHHSGLEGPTIEQVQKLANLVTLRVPISDVQVSELQGWTGTLRLVMAIHGDVEIATDLSTARLEDIDRENRSGLLVLHRPTPVRPRLDHEKTRIVELQRSGLWWLVNGQAGEDVLTNRAMEHAQQALVRIADQEDIVGQACQHASEVFGKFFNAMGWEIAVQWEIAAGSKITEPSVVQNQ